ncbi:neuroglobin [Aplysia californica]|uniref:Globin n=1 Tax=Aplysia californica TaxID=6500 RepID=A0ABM1A378_APLCA|nr:neuroglobin [Aplysia californica]
MGQTCSTSVKKKLGLTESVKEKNKRIYLCNEEGEEMSSSSMRGLPMSRPDLPAQSREIVVQSWEIIKRDIERVGVVMFMGLLEDPEIRGTFMTFRDKTVEELKASTALRSHVLRVMGAVEKVVARLDNKEKMVALLHDLGQRHMSYNARPEFLDLVGPQFNNAIQPALGDKWTPEVEQAWADLFRYITHVMKETMVM